MIKKVIKIQIELRLMHCLENSPTIYHAKKNQGRQRYSYRIMFLGLPGRVKIGALMTFVRILCIWVTGKGDGGSTPISAK